MWYLHSPSLPWPRTYLRHMYFLQILLATHFQERQCDWEWLCGNFEEQDLALAALMFCEDFERPWKGHCFGELVQRLRKLCAHSGGFTARESWLYQLWTQALRGSQDRVFWVQGQNGVKAVQAMKINLNTLLFLPSLLKTLKAIYQGSAKAHYIPNRGGDCTVMTNWISWDKGQRRTPQPQVLLAPCCLASQDPHRAPHRH